MQPALFDVVHPNFGIEWCRRKQFSSNSEPGEAGSGRTVGNPLTLRSGHQAFSTSLIDVQYNFPRVGPQEAPKDLGPKLANIGQTQFAEFAASLNRSARSCYSCVRKLCVEELRAQVLCNSAHLAPLGQLRSNFLRSFSLSRARVLEVTSRMHEKQPSENIRAVGLDPEQEGLRCVVQRKLPARETSPT